MSSGQTEIQRQLDISHNLERIERLEPELHALLNRTVIAPTGEGSLSGLTATIKDVLVTEGVETTAGSKMLAGWIPPYQATAVARLRAAGATLIGKANCDAWAHGSSTENSDFGPTKNPWDTTRVPGGSSGGSAAAMAAGYVDCALGTDTGGSIRQPAAFCGVTGLKVTYGRVSRSGLIAMASSFDTIGPMARDAATCARVLEAIAGHDPADATSVPGKTFSASSVTSEVEKPTTYHLPPTTSRKPLRGLRIGIPKEYFAEGLGRSIEHTVRSGIDQLVQLGATLVDISLPSTNQGIACYYVLVPAEISSNLARFDGIRFGHSVLRRQETGDRRQESMRNTQYAIRESEQRMSHVDLVKRNRQEGFGAEAKRRMMIGTFVLSAGYVDAYYKQAMRVRTLFRQEFTNAFKTVDVIATPTTPTVAFKLGAHADDPLAMYLEDVYTVPVNLAGLPAVSVPCGFVTEPTARQQDSKTEDRSRASNFQLPASTEVQLPVGLQLIGPMFGEATILRTAHWYQQATDYHKRTPSLVEKLT